MPLPPCLGLPVHPHACGERFRVVRVMDAIIGSSPRLWGTSEFVFERRDTSRFIPTPVGNVTMGRSARHRRSVHPHACGERSPRAGRPSSATGSSPRLWGTSSAGRRPQAGARFIPTPVGNVVLVLAHLFLISVHPHACGERPVSSPDTRVGHGSSPRLWGTCPPP